MLITLMTRERLPEWASLAEEVALLFGHADMARDAMFQAFQTRVIDRREALCAVDYASGSLMGIIAYSSKRNEIAWFAVCEAFRGRGAGRRLLMTALRQLDGAQPISVTTFTQEEPGGQAARALYTSCGFNETGLFESSYGPRVIMQRQPDGAARGHSFHYNIKGYMDEASAQGCPFCNGAPCIEGHIPVHETNHSLIEALMAAQGGLYGKCHIIYKGGHASDITELSHAEAGFFMGDISAAARALKAVTGAVKINIELHGNTGAHLHAHLFPRYLDDPFPSAPIDYRITEPCPYADEADFMLFVSRFRTALSGV